MNSFVKISSSFVSSAILASALLSGGASAVDLSAVPSGAYELDPTHAYINFQYNHLGLSNPTLSFDDFTVDLNLDNADPTQSSINVTIDPNSIISGSEIWKDHLIGEKWFDTANNPEITFQSTAIESAGDGAYKATGDLTIKGFTKPVELNISINAAMNHPMSGDPVIGLDASGTVLRSEFGMGGIPPVSDEIALNLSVEMTKAAE